MQEDIKQQLKSAINEGETELERLGDLRTQKRSELRQLRKALSALGGARQKMRKSGATPTASVAQTKLGNDTAAR